MVLRDAMIVDNWTDDRPPAIPKGFIEGLNDAMIKIIEKHPESLPAFTEKNKNDEDRN